MHNWVILNNIIKTYDNKYEFIPTVDVQSFALSPNGIIVLDVNKWKKPDLFFIFSVLHEIGHCETYKKGQSKVTREYLATVWAIKEFNKLKLKLSTRDKRAWQDYIYSFSKAKNKEIKYRLDWDMKGE